MPEHRIRLRGGWEVLDSGGGGLPSRLTFPLKAFPDGVGRVRLARSFQTPPLDPRSETLWLRLDAVPGLVSVLFNDRELARGPFGTAVLLLPLGDALPARNRITLDVAPCPGSGCPSEEFPWGEIALVIARGDLPADPGAA